MPSEHVVAREIEGEIIIVPLMSGIGNVDDELFALNETGKQIWKRLDGAHTLSAIIEEISQEYRAEPGLIEADVLGLVEELVTRKILVAI